MTAVTSVNAALTEEAKALTLNTDTEYMKPDLQSLHIGGRDEEFEKQWYREGCVKER